MKYISHTFLILLIFSIFSAYTLNEAFNKGYDLSSNYPPRENAIISIVFNITKAHLLLEELLSGDDYVKKDEIHNLTHQAMQKVKLLQNGGSLSARNLILKPLKDPFILEKLSKLNNYLELFDTTIQHRYNNKNQSAIGSKADQQFDVIYRDTLNLAKEIENFLIQQSQQELTKYTNIHYILLSLLILFFIVSLIYTFIKEKQIIENNKNLLKAQKDLTDSMILFSENVIASKSDPKGTITYVSDALCKISEFSKEELIGMPHSKLRHPDMASSVFANLWSTIQSGQIWEGEIKNRTKSGGHYWVRTFIRPDFDEHNNIIGFSSVRHDISPQKAKEEFMANMSHELRTPLNSIIGFSNILLKKVSQKANLEMIEQIAKSSKSLLSLINDILDLAKIQNSKFTITPYEFEPYTEIKNNYNYIKGLTENKNLYLHYNIDKNLKLILLGDWTRINQIILNLMSNAVKFTPDDGTITFNSKYEDGKLCLSVEDNGIGMNKEILNKVFQPFEQADGSTTRKYGGTGLGLNITQNLVELMNGTLEVESQENIGTIFRVQIPLEKIKEIQTKDENEISTEEKKPLHAHVLVAEDNKTNQMLIKILLEEFEITCDIANDGSEALEMYNPKNHALILMDENMPNMNGIESMKAIRKKHQGIHPIIIAVTANAMAGDKEKFIKLGMDAYVSKPIDDNELYAVLQHYLSS